MKGKLWMCLCVVAVFVISCTGGKKESSCCGEEHEANGRIVSWAKDAVIYEVNLRQYTEEGTIAAFMKELPRLEKLGVDILWLMPIHPISEKNRKGSKGSYYAVQDYKKVNPEFGTNEEFRQLVEEAHRRGMYVMLDWVANHTGWDNPWLLSNKEWYTQDSLGQVIIPEGTDWSDVADLNYDNRAMREAMIEALVYWVKEFDIDGYRCDVAGKVPTDFWEEARSALEEEKRVLMLAEDEGTKDLLNSAFDFNYGWDMHHCMNKVAQGEDSVGVFDQYFAKHTAKMPQGTFSMHFITNHDENSWNKTEFERMGDAVEAMAVFSFMIPGMPLIYTGQEFGSRKELAFFEKDVFTKDATHWQAFYSKLIDFKKENPALYHGEQGGDFERIAVGDVHKVYAFSRKKGESEVLAIFNFSAEEQILDWNTLVGEAVYIPIALPGEKEIIPQDGKLSLSPWSYFVGAKK